MYLGMKTICSPKEKEKLSFTQSEYVTKEGQNS